MSEASSSSPDHRLLDEKPRFKPRPSLSQAWVDETLRLGTAPQALSALPVEAALDHAAVEFADAAEAPTAPELSHATETTPPEAVEAEPVATAASEAEPVATAPEAEPEATAAPETAAEPEPKSGVVPHVVAESGEEEEFFSAPRAAEEDEFPELHELEEQTPPLSPEELAHARRFVPWVGGAVAALALLGGAALIAATPQAGATALRAGDQLAVTVSEPTPQPRAQKAEQTAVADAPPAPRERLDPVVTSAPAEAETRAAPEPPKAPRAIAKPRSRPAAPRVSRPAAPALPAPPLAAPPEPTPVVQAPGGPPPTAAFPID